MNKIILTSLLVLLTAAASAQEVIENPAFKGTTANYIRVVKVELTDTATAIGFRVHFSPNMWIRVPKETWIQDSKGGEKLFVKSAKGIKIDAEHFTPESGINEYTLYFPPVGKDVEAIDYLENQWKIFGIDLGRSEKFSIFPEPLLGNWLRTDGSNEWVYGFHEDLAIYDNNIWKQVLISQTDGVYQVVLQKDGRRKKLFVKQQDKNLLIGTDENSLQPFSRELTNNPDYRIANDEEFQPPVFKKDSAVYCGIIKGYHPDMGTTGMIYVNNIISSEQESYLIKINSDGSFAARFQMIYPQQILVRMLNFNEAIFCEPGKTTFQMNDFSKYHDDDSPGLLFMGPTAQINQDLIAMKWIQFYNYHDMTGKILDISPEDFKSYFLDIKNREIETVDEYAQSHAVSKKALQIKKMQIGFSAGKNILSFNMDRRMAYRVKHQVPREQRTIPLDLVEMPKEYYDYIHPEELNNPLAVLAGGEYYFLLNRLRFSEVLSPKKLELKTTADEYFKEFEANNIHLNFDEKELIKKIGSESDSIRKNLFKQDSLFVKKFVDNHSTIFQTVNTRRYTALNRDFKDKALIEFFGIYPGNFARNLMLVQEEYGKIKSAYEPITEVRKEDLKNQISSEFLLAELFNASEDLQMEIKRKQEIYQNKSGFNVNETPEITEGDLFDSIMKKYKGKVVFVDFWATWCGPCRSGMEQMKPLKEEMKDKDLVFVYITNPSSPQKTWEMLIPDIHGEHYYLTQDEWNAMAARFNVSGIPHYMLVDKKGKVVRDHLMFASSGPELKKVLEQYLTN